MSFLSTVLVLFAKNKVNAKRIEAFLECSEYEEAGKIFTGEKGSISISNGDFAWESDEIKEKSENFKKLAMPKMPMMKKPPPKSPVAPPPGNKEESKAGVNLIYLTRLENCWDRRKPGFRNYERRRKKGKFQ